MKETVQVLWIDDEYKDNHGLRMNAMDVGVQLNPYKSVEEGISELENNIEYYDGVLLDAYIFESRGDVRGTEDVEYIFRAKEKIDGFTKKFEIHVLTGQAEVFEDEMFHKVFDKVFKKGVDDDINRLFASLKQSARKQQDYQLKSEYSQVFEACNSKYGLEDSWPIVLDLLKILDDDKSSITTVKQFNPIRKVLENIFHGLNNFDLLPDRIVQNSGWLNGSSLFIVGKHREFNCGHEIATKAIQHILTNLMFTVQDACHMKGYLRVGVHDHINSIKSDYLFRSSVYQLLDVILWYKEYVDSNPDTIDWEYTGEDFEPIDGVIEQDENGIYSCEGYLLNDKRINQLGLSQGDTIKITDVVVNEIGHLKEKYPQFAVRWTTIK